MEQRKRGITGSTFKMIAIVAMLIDHIAAVVLNRILLVRGMREAFNEADSTIVFLNENSTLYYSMLAMRQIGRLGFPIFCFLLVEGFCRTRNVWKYALRLGLFALISEIPFNLALNGTLSNRNYQNVFFTLAIGLFVLIGLRAAQQAAGKRALRKSGWFAKTIHGLEDILILVAGFLLAEFLKTDYAGMGVMTIAVMYLVRTDNFAYRPRNRMLSMGIGCLVLTLSSLAEITSFFALIPAAQYNNERGWKMKYFFYGFYPVHLFLLWVICYFLGMGNIPAI